MKRALKSDFEAAVSNRGDDIYSHGGDLFDLHTDTNTYLRTIGDSTERRIRSFDGFAKWLKNENKYNKMTFWPISQVNQTASFKEFKGAFDLTENGDTTFDQDGISGGGASPNYFDMGFRPVADISNINDWAFGVYSQTDNDAGTDIGCDDGTDAHYIKCKSGGNLEVCNGQKIVSGTVGSGIGCFAMSCQSGTVKAFWGGEEIGSSGPVSGSLVNLNMFMGAVNQSATDADHSAKKYSFAWVYNGAHDDTFIKDLHYRIENLQLFNIRGNAIS